MGAFVFPKWKNNNRSLLWFESFLHRIMPPLSFFMGQNTRKSVSSVECWIYTRSKGHWTGTNQRALEIFSSQCCSSAFLDAPEGYACRWLCCCFIPLFFFFCKIKYFAIPDFFNKIKYSLCYILLCIYIYKNKGLYEVLLPTILDFFQCNLNTGIYINFMKTKQRNRGLKL